MGEHYGSIRPGRVVEKLEAMAPSKPSALETVAFLSEKLAAVAEELAAARARIKALERLLGHAKTAIGDFGDPALVLAIEMALAGKREK